MSSTSNAKQISIFCLAPRSFSGAPGVVYKWAFPVLNPPAKSPIEMMGSTSSLLVQWYESSFHKGAALWALWDACHKHRMRWSSSGPTSSCCLRGLMHPPSFAHGLGVQEVSQSGKANQGRWVLPSDQPQQLLQTCHSFSRSWRNLHGTKLPRASSEDSGTPHFSPSRTSRRTPAGWSCDVASRMRDHILGAMRSPVLKTRIHRPSIFQEELQLRAGRIERLFDLLPVVEKLVHMERSTLADVRSTPCSSSSSSRSDGSPSNPGVTALGGPGAISPPTMRSSGSTSWSSRSLSLGPYSSLSSAGAGAVLDSVIGVLFPEASLQSKGIPTAAGTAPLLDGR